MAIIRTLPCEDGHYGYTGAMFHLTRRERTIVIFLLVAFVMGFGVRHWRGLQALSTPTISATP